MAAACPGLQTLAAMDVSKLTDQGLVALSEGCPRLQVGLQVAGANASAHTAVAHLGPIRAGVRHVCTPHMQIGPCTSCCTCRPPGLRCNRTAQASPSPCIPGCGSLHRMTRCCAALTCAMLAAGAEHQALQQGHRQRHHCRCVPALHGQAGAQHGAGPDRCHRKGACGVLRVRLPCCLSCERKDCAMSCSLYNFVLRTGSRLRRAAACAQLYRTSPRAQPPRVPCGLPQQATGSLCA